MRKDANVTLIKSLQKNAFLAFLNKKATNVIKTPYDGNSLNYYILIDHVLKLVICSSL